MKTSIIRFEIEPEYETESGPMSPIWEQVLPFIDNRNIVEEDGDYGIDSSCFLAQEHEFYHGKLLIAICGCTCAGCSSTLCDVDTTDKYVSWKIYRYQNPQNYRLYVFDINQYQNAINELVNKTTKNEDKLKEWAEFFFYYAKEDLMNTILAEETTK